MENKSSLGVVSLVLGIVAIVLCLTIGVLFPWAALICGIIGLVLGIKARKAAPSGMATAGFVLSIIGLAWAVIQIIMVVACLGAIGGSLAAIGSLM